MIMVKDRVGKSCKGKQRWVPKIRHREKRVKNGNLIIGENHGQLGNNSQSETSSSFDEDGFNSNLGNCKGDTSRPEAFGITSRSPSLEGPLKEYFDRIEKAFVMAKFKFCMDPNLSQTRTSEDNLKQATGEENSETVVQETNLDSEANKTVEEDVAPDDANRNTCSETWEEEDNEEESRKIKRRKMKKTKGLPGKSHGMRTRNKGLEVTNGGMEH
ncbi:hypothetical protein QYF36_008766 [Acer negundo]|nr:hypothetical protein QYF36_008766 [Acer negundo]